MKYKDEESRYVIFGAGLTGKALLHYLGKDNVDAFIDNDINKIGMKIEEVPIISLDVYMQNYKDDRIVVSIYSKHYFDCVQQLQRKGIKDYYTAPPVAYNYLLPEEMAEEILNLSNKRIIFYGLNPISHRIWNYIVNNGRNEKELLIMYSSQEVGNSDIVFEDIRENDLLVVTTNEIEENIRERIIYKLRCKVFDIYANISKVHKELQRYKNIYEGKRCFIIGNGPSLASRDLEILNNYGEITFGCNGIFNIYDKTCWRPTYYVAVDIGWIEEKQEEIAKLKNEILFLTETRYIDASKIEGANYFTYCNEIKPGEELRFSNDISKEVISGKTVTYGMLQIACYMGFKKIYLLGVDWTGGKGTGVPRYDFYNRTEVISVDEYDLFMEEELAYISAKKYSDKNGIKIYNATRGGELEVFERKDFDSLFS